MPTPGETRTYQGETRTWTGSGWELSTDPRGQSMLHVPPPHERDASSRTDDNDLELLKQLLTTGGTIAGGVLAGPPGAVAGGAAGRMLGHVPEALRSRTTGTPNESSFMGDAALGAGEGAIQEALPMMGRPLAAVGRGVQTVARTLGKGGELAPALRAMLGGAAGELIGAGHAGAMLGGGAAAVGPKIAEAAGSGMERAGNAIGSEPLSTRTRSALDWLMDGPAAREGAAGKQAADLRRSFGLRQGKEIPYRAGSGSPGEWPQPGPAGPSLKEPDALETLLQGEPRRVMTPEEFRVRDLRDQTDLQNARRGGMQSAAKAYKP